MARATSNIDCPSSFSYRILASLIGDDSAAVSAEIFIEHSAEIADQRVVGVVDRNCNGGTRFVSSCSISYRDVNVGAIQKARRGVVLRHCLHLCGASRTAGTVIPGAGAVESMNDCVS